MGLGVSKNNVSVAGWPGAGMILAGLLRRYFSRLSGLAGLRLARIVGLVQLAQALLFLLRLFGEFLLSLLKRIIWFCQLERLLVTE